MRSLVARLIALGAFAVTVSACGGGNGLALPFAGGPNNGGGGNGTIQTGSNGQALIRFIQGSPDASPATAGVVDVCIDNLPFGSGTAGTAVAYGKVAPALYAVPGGISHTIAVYPTLSGGQAGAQCSTAPGPYFGTSAIKVTTISPAAFSRQTVVLGGTVGGGTLGLYVYGEPTFAATPGSPEAISHNAAPTFSAGPPPRGVGFGICTTTVTPCAAAVALTGAQNLAAPKASGVAAATANGSVTSPLAGVPAGFYDGIGVAAGTPVPITSIAAPAVTAQPYVVQLYAIDGPAGGLNLVGFVETTAGIGF